VLPAERRVRRREQFTAAVRAGDRASAAGLVIHVWRAPTSDPAGAGFIVGRSVGPAVARNRLRRRLRHLLAPRLAEMPPGTVVIVRATAAAAGRSGRSLAVGIDTALDRAFATVTA
jgi:ribonuclease P protein component